MSTIFTLFMVLIVIASVLLIIIVMAQNPKGGGLSSTFGGGSSAQFGVQRTNEFMEKTTWTLGIVVVVLCLLSVILTAEPSHFTPSNNATSKTEQTTQKAPTNQQETPAATTEQQAPATGN